MKSFFFSSGLGSTNCNGAPRDAIVVKSPNHTQVTFNANGVQISIASTIVLKATAHQSMSVQLVEGHAQVTTSEGTQTLKPGEEVNVPLGGDDGLHEMGAPSVPHTASPAAGLSAVIPAPQRDNIPVDSVVNHQRGSTTRGGAGNVGKGKSSGDKGGDDKGDKGGDDKGGDDKGGDDKGDK